MTRRAALLAVEIVLLVILMGYVFAGWQTVPFHGDEATFINMSHDYHYLVQLRDPAAMRHWWRIEHPYDYTLRLLNGSLNPLSIGLAWDLVGMTDDDITGQWNWDITTPRYGITQWEDNVRRGNLPGDDLLFVARTPSALLTALSVALVFVIARLAAGSLPGVSRPAVRIASWVAALGYATTPAVLVNGRRAMQEGGMLFFTALVILVALGVARAQTRVDVRWRTLAGWYLALGLTSGAAIAAKHTSALVIAAVFLALLIQPRLRRAGSPGVCFDARHVCNLVAAGLVTLLVAMALLPILWSGLHTLVLGGLIVICAAIGGGLHDRRLWIAVGVGALIATGAMVAWGTSSFDQLMAPLDILDERANLMDIQVQRIGGVDTLGERVAALVHEAFFAAPQYFEDQPWAEFAVTSEQIATYEASGLAGRSGGVVWGVALIALAGAGLVILARRWREDPALLMVAWLLVPPLALLATNRLPWQRYYLLLHAPLLVVAAVGAGWLVMAVERRAGRTAAPPAT